MYLLIFLLACAPPKPRTWSTSRTMVEVEDAFSPQTADWEFSGFVVKSGAKAVAKDPLCAD